MPKHLTNSTKMKKCTLIVSVFSFGAIGLVCILSYEIKNRATSQLTSWVRIAEVIN